ncbi:MAG: exonuclease SbcCD subunit D [Saprospiraceae bacterium]
MRILHFSDTHLGYQAYDHVNSLGVNTREDDVYRAFEQVIDAALRLRPDLMIHAGDVFHRPSPSNRALTFALEQLNRLVEAKIPLCVIAGNHEAPRNAFTAPILKALGVLPGVEAFFEPVYAYREYGPIAVHALPHVQDPRNLQQELGCIRPQPGRFNLLIMHLSLGARYLMDEYGEQRFPDEALSALAQFDYVALGHWHKTQKAEVKANAWYCGATESFSDAETGVPKGFLLLDTEQAQKPVFHPIANRPWTCFEIRNCYLLSVQEIYAQLEALSAAQDTRDHIVTLGLHGLSASQYLTLNNQELRRFFPDCMQLNIKRSPAESAPSFAEQLEGVRFESLGGLFDAYIVEQYADQPEFGKKIRALAKRYFEIAETP